MPANLNRCTSILSEILRIPRGNNLSSRVSLFQKEVRESDAASAKGDRMILILRELAADLDHYEHDPFKRDQDTSLLGEVEAFEKIREALDALDNVERVMPWLK